MLNIRSIITGLEAHPATSPEPTKAKSAHTLVTTVKGVAKEHIGTTNIAKTLAGRVSLGARHAVISNCAAMRGIRKIS